jgi:antitoxin PrlF
MAIAQSKITTQGQISVPAEIRKKLGVGPGATIEWEEINDQVFVRRAGQHTSAEVHQALFGTTPSSMATDDVKAGIYRYIKKRHARS